MTREQLYHMYKGILCKSGMIPESYTKYAECIDNLINVYQARTLTYEFKDMLTDEL